MSLQHDSENLAVGGDLIVHGEVHPTRYAWSDIRPKVSAAGLAYSACLAASAVAADFGVDLSTGATQAVTGFVMLLAAYLWPEG